MSECVGHYGYVKLVLPVFHVGFFKHTISILQVICKSCSAVLLDEADRRKYLRAFRRKGLENLKRTQTFKQVNTAARKVVHCPHCGNTNGVVKKAGPLKIIHEKFRAKKTAEEQAQFYDTFEYMINTGGTGPGSGTDVKQHLGRAQDDLNPLKVLELFKRISDEDCELLGLRPEHGRPEEYLWQYITVPPVCIRPAVQQETATNEDDLTIKIAEIVFANALVRTSIARGAPVNQLVEQWDFLQMTCALYINSELPGVAASMGTGGGKPVRGFCQRLKGKSGRFRGNLSGKRVDFSGRTVISPDPNLRIDEVAVPERVAKILTYPERVNEYNIEKLRLAVINGPDVHPGANFIVDGKTGFKRMIKFMARREDGAKYLKIGDIVERHIHDDDIVLFNRQPSLHKLSIMSHRVKVRPWRTFRLNECVCSPYNADFDGDEMNMHVPQTEEARTEATILMGVKANLITPRNGEPIIAATQDFITAAYLLTKRDRLLNRAQIAQVCAAFGDATTHIDLPPPTIIKPERLWTGKQAFNLLMRPNQREAAHVLVNLEAKCRTFEKARPGFIEDMSPNDGFLVIQNSEIMCGVVDKASVGDGKKNSIFGVMQRDYGSNMAAEAMNRLAKTCARWLSNQGFSLGINDVMPGIKLQTHKDNKVEVAYARCLDLIEKAKLGQLQNEPGCDQDLTLENKISGVLSDVRKDVGDICMSELSRHNAPLVMAVCGSKGSTINVAQMVACVGQQIISGKRVPNGFQERSLPHFAKKSKDPPSKGFVRNSFYSGLTPTEFLFHAISGREGLVDTAVKTAETGYMQRRLMKALEDLSTHYDTSVRNSVGGVVQFVYGDDGLDPAELEADALPVEYLRTWRHARAITQNVPSRMLMPFEITEVVDKHLAHPRFTQSTQMYHQQIRNFIRDSVVTRAARLREAYGLFSAEERGEEWDEDTDLSMGADAASIKAVDNKTKVTLVQVDKFMQLCWEKYMRAKVEPGTAVGAIGAQSIGEPGTQMTLKTFHFAGVASMNVTRGVPRIKEIINAAKVISTPIIETSLVSDKSEAAARIVKGRIEKTFLTDVTSVIEEVVDRDYAYVGLHVDLETITKLQLEISVADVKRAIVKAPRLRINESRVQMSEKLGRIRIYIDREDENGSYALSALRRQLDTIIVTGIQNISHAIVTPEKGVYKVRAEGYGLKDVMTTVGVIGEHTYTNHVMEMAEVLGIEAARSSIYNEIQETMNAHGLGVDPRHVMLLADVMSYKGEVLGITRFGVAKMKDSVLMLASFEKTTDHLFDAALFGKNDGIEGVSESIIMGKPTHGLGTGLPSLVSARPILPPPRRLLFDRPRAPTMVGAAA